MRILILGGDGMLGHKLLQHFQSVHSARVTVQQDLTAYEHFALFNPRNSYAGVNARSSDRVQEVLADFRPEVVVNAIGIVKQRAEAKESIPSLEINALFPHRLAVMCKAVGARLIHMSTDCVFSGRKGNYTEHDKSDADDLYGRTKFLGELHEPHCLTLRTSIIGRELSRKAGLVEWFLTQKGGRCRGFSRAIYSGLTTQALAEVMTDLIEKYPKMSGLYHLSSDPISKYDLLQLVNEIYRLGVTIEKDTEFVCDRSLDSTRFRQATGWRSKPWQAMIEQMAQDCTPYSAWE
jgi:dTDP-4-dehydrorhamnose reductase